MAQKVCIIEACGKPWDPFSTHVVGQPKNGHLEVLQWARQNGCEWDPWTCCWAAKNGHLEVLQWARQNGYEWDSQTCRWAAKMDI